MRPESVEFLDFVPRRVKSSDGRNRLFFGKAGVALEYRAVGLEKVGAGFPLGDRFVERRVDRVPLPPFFGLAQGFPSFLDALEKGVVGKIVLFVRVVLEDLAAVRLSNVVLGGLPAQSTQAEDRIVVLRLPLERVRRQQRGGLGLVVLANVVSRRGQRHGLAHSLVLAERSVVLPPACMREIAGAGRGQRQQRQRRGGRPHGRLGRRRPRRRRRAEKQKRKVHVGNRRRGQRPGEHE